MKPAEKYRAWKAHRPEKPIFRTILFSMMAVLLAEVILLSTGIGLTNVSGRLNQNAKQIVNMQVRNRASYLQDMLIKAQELTDISTTINNLTQQMLQDGTISLDTMDQSSEAADPLMEAAAPYLVSALRARPVTGIFLVINTHDLAEKEVGSPMPSVYLRDLDPDARPSDHNTDLMLERSSAAVVKALGITTDKSWSTALNYRGLTNGSFVRTVFQTAWEDDEDSLTIEEKVARNRDPDCPIWYDILPWDCPGHEWSEVEPNYEDDGTTLRIWNSRSCLNCGYTETIGEVECVPVENGPECVEPEDTDAEEYHNDPVTDEEIQAAPETFDPTIDDPQYQREYERYQRDHGNQEEAEDVGSPVLYEEAQR